MVLETTFIGYTIQNLKGLFGLEMSRYWKTSFKEADLEANQESLFNLNQITDKQINKQNRTVEQNQSVQQNQTRQNQISRINQFSDSEDNDIDKLALLGTYQNEPKSYKEARNSPNWPHWLTAIGIEINQLNKQKT